MCHFCNVTLQELGIHFEKDVKSQLLLRMQQAVEHLVGAIAEAYYSGNPRVIGSHGASGAIGSLQSQIKQAGSVLTAIIGPSAAHAYFRYLESGVRPASSDPAAGPAYKRMPPARIFAEWSRLARLTVPAKFMPKGDRNAKGRVKGGHARKRKDGLSGEAAGRMNWGFAMARNRMKYGYKGMLKIIRVAQRETDNIRRILEHGASA